MKPTLSIVTPAVQVITLERAKLAAKLAGNERDDEVADAIATARAWCQEYLVEAIGPQVLKFTYEAWCGSAVLPYEITGLQALTANGVDVQADATVTGRRVTVQGDAPVEITIETGYTAETLPAPVKSAMLLMIVDLIRNPQGQVEVQLYANPAVENLLWPYRARVPI